VATVNESASRQEPSISRHGIRQPSLDLLVVIDSSEPSSRALRYLADFFATRRDVRFCLTYLTPHLPPALLESGGAEEPEREERIETAMREEQQRWVGAASEASQDVIRRASATLYRAGADVAAVTSCETSPFDNRSPAEELLIVAEQQRCRTIVVGHSAHSWFRSFTGGHLAEHLVQHAKGITIWVVD
jgi:nucleotide-binding universal stress UspA family protein